MKRTTRSITLTWLTCLSLVLSLCAGILVSDKAQAAKGTHPKADKVASDLRQRRVASSTGQASVSVIVQLNGPISGALNALLNQNGVHLRKRFQNFNAMTVELPLSIVDDLELFDEVDYVSVDSQLNALGHLTSTTGADDVRAQTTATGTAYTLDGTGIGIAVLDSGMLANHKAFVNASGAGRIVYSKDFTGENRTDDPYGHGTHVATLAAGASVAGTNSSYVGVAPNANLINLRVLNSQGSGTVSQILSALDWVLTNRVTYNIRVVNMSLGMPAISSYKNDPVCVATRKLVNAGVVVVAAAGNDGKNQYGQKIYGTVHSPGIEPSAITVGATNTFGTDTRGDDGLTSYSSRGPTRSYWTDLNGNKHYDNLVKPDLVAPGNKLIAAESAGNLIVTTYPSLDAGAAKQYYRYMYLSGTSMATPLTAGAAALLLQANPKLTPNMVKMILMYTAQQLPNLNMFEQGAGELNIEGAVRLAKAVRTDLSSTTALGAPLLTTATAPTPQSMIAGTTFSWAQGIVMNQTYAKGSSLITKYQKVYGLGVLLSDGTMLSNGVLVSDATMMSSGVLLGDNIMVSNGVLLGDGYAFCATGVLLGDGVLLSDGVLLGDGVLISDGVLVGDGVLIGDSIRPQAVMVNGDNTACMR